jgi:hypothetical protein
VTKKEIAPQLKKSAGTSRAKLKIHARVVNYCRWREDMGPSTGFLVPWFGGAMGGGVRRLRLDAYSREDQGEPGGVDTGHTRRFARSAAREMPAQRSRWPRYGLREP